MQYQVVIAHACTILLSKHTAMAGGDDFVYWMHYYVGVMLALDEQQVRLYCSAHAQIWRC